MLIIGMHRSGTSAIAGLIAAQGAYIAPESLLLPAGNDNPHGFWERQDALAINRKIMKAQNCNWHYIQGFSSEIPIAENLKTELRLCVDDLQSKPVFALKDPRLCLTMPYWLPYFRQMPLIVFAVRHPAAIAQSLLQRNNMPLMQGLLLWEKYISYALENISKYNAKIISCRYEDLIDNPEQEAARLHKKIAEFYPLLKLPESLRIYKTAPQRTIDNNIMTKQQQNLYNILLEL